MTLVIALGYVAAAALAVRGLALRSDARVLRRLVEGLGRLPSSGAVSMLERIGRRAPAPIRDRARRSATGGRELDRIAGAKLVLGLAGLVVGVAAASSLPARVALAAALGAGGFTLPSFRVARHVAGVSTAVRGAIPDALDIVAVCVSAGLTPRLALERASAAVPEPLASELDAVRRDVTLGIPWVRALSDVASRTGLEELKRLATTLARSERLGSPVAERLRVLARDVRAERRAEAEERARRAPVVMLFPLVFLILPAFVLTAVVPAVLVATRGIP